MRLSNSDLLLFFDVCFMLASHAPMTMMMCGCGGNQKINAPCLNIWNILNPLIWEPAQMNAGLLWRGTLDWVSVWLSYRTPYTVQYKSVLLAHLPTQFQDYNLYCLEPSTEPPASNKRRKTIETTTNLLSPPFVTKREPNGKHNPNLVWTGTPRDHSGPTIAAQSYCVQ